jgi:hypothetical protein
MFLHPDQKKVSTNKNLKNLSKKYLELFLNNLLPLI